MIKSVWLPILILMSIVLVSGCIDTNSNDMPEPDEPIYEDQYNDNARLDKVRIENPTTISIDDVSLEAGPVEVCFDTECATVEIEVHGSANGYATCFGNEFIIGYLYYPVDYNTYVDEILEKEYVGSGSQGGSLEHEDLFPAPFYPNTGCTDVVTWSAQGSIYHVFKGQQIMIVADLYNKDGKEHAQATEIVTPFP